MSTAEIHTIDGDYMIEFEHVPNGFRVKDVSGHVAAHTYTPPYCDTSLYFTQYGVWRYTHSNKTWGFSKDQTHLDFIPAIVRECGIPQMRGKHYDALIMDDMPIKGSESTAEDVKKAVDWHMMMQKGEKKMSRDYIKKMFDACQASKPMRQGIITNITKGGNGMKQLYHVILFDKKTEKIVFKEYIPAIEPSDAMMIAAQAYGKYDANIHMTIIKTIDNSGYSKVEPRTAVE